MKLSQADRKALKDSGITHASIIEERVQQGYTNRVLRGRTIHGETMFGTAPAARPKPATRRRSEREALTDEGQLIDKRRTP